MIQREVYGSELIKKRRYWPRGFHGDGINDYFRSTNIGGVGYVSGDGMRKSLIFLF